MALVKLAMFLGGLFQREELLTANLSPGGPGGDVSFDLCESLALAAHTVGRRGQQRVEFRG